MRMTIIAAIGEYHKRGTGGTFAVELPEGAVYQRTLSSSAPMRVIGANPKTVMQCLFVGDLDRVKELRHLVLVPMGVALQSVEGWTLLGVVTNPTNEPAALWMMPFGAEPS